jgi:alpha-methylacyl-CoA racemase
VGPLDSIRIVELGGIGPAPMCAMLLADLGARVIRLERPGAAPTLGIPDRFVLLNRSRGLLEIDLKSAVGNEAVLRLVENADAVIEGFRPGVAERLGLGPDECLARNAKVVYGRMTGWGQTGPLANVVGHDIDYIGLVGALHAIGPAEGPPRPPLSLVGDYGGGALYLAMGVLAGIVEASRSGKGQIVDAAMIDGAASLMTVVYGMRAAGLWQDERDANMLDGGAPFYACYETKDRKWIAVGALEPQFWEALVRELGLDRQELPDRNDRANWPVLRARLAAIFRDKTRDEWVARLGTSDACFAPVLSLDEAPLHPHHRARGTFVEVDGIVQPAAAPRFSRTPTGVPRPPARKGEDPTAVLRAFGLDDDLVAEIRRATASADAGSA